MTIVSHPLRMGAAGFLASIVIGCGGSAGTPSSEHTPSLASATVIVETSEFEFDPPDLTIASSGRTDITLVNKGTMVHDLTIDALEFQIQVPVGKQSSGTLRDPAAGTYEVYCAVPGHKALGMVATLVVEA